MKTTASLLLAAVLALAACGGSSSHGIDLQTDPDVQAILAGYQKLGATQIELDAMVDMIDEALDVYDNEADRRDYLREIRVSLEDTIEQLDEFRESEGYEPIDP